ncbi:hypothetical protein BDB01DRAFT_814354 [Pilobolus umbonatus]|nr:hypothetical protein BDB01DRAFT_814354 [Pilobolus umbonatus]
MSTQEIFIQFKRYDWKTDRVFEAGLNEDLKRSLYSPGEEDIMHSIRLLKAKHFYFSKFQHKFDLEEYLEYEQQQLLKSQEEEFEKMEAYEYNEDEEYLSGLGKIIPRWLEVASVWSKEKLESEITKAKAYYYHSKIAPIDLNAYWKWKEAKEQKNQPVCPFASTWQYKNKVIPSLPFNGRQFISTERPKGKGALKITLSSPRTHNTLTVTRLDQMYDTINITEKDEKITTIFMTSNISHVGNSMDFNEQIETKDSKIVSSGLALKETSEIISNADQLRSSLDYMGDKYYHLVKYLMQNAKKIVSFTNGLIPVNAVYCFLSVGFLRVITEHTLVDIQLKLSHAPIPPLLLLNMCRLHSQKALPKGLELYLALASPDYSKLRGPELLRIGLADIFIPEIKLNDVLDISKTMASCPEPHTTSAVQLALSIHQTYAGPNRISVWENKIESLFGSATTFEALEEGLRKDNSKWSQSILNHWQRMPPTLLRVIFKAINQTRSMAPSEILVLERSLNSYWRQTKDYEEWLKEGSRWAQGKEVEETVDSYFRCTSLSHNVAPVIYEAIEKEEEVPVCPVTGQRATAAGEGCPSQKGMNDVCPVTGQQASLSMKGCPVSSSSVSSC